ncbi:hypothetical protein Tco_0620620 [Tanacetum coccineum]
MNRLILCTQHPREVKRFEAKSQFQSVKVPVRISRKRSRDTWEREEPNAERSTPHCSQTPVSGISKPRPKSLFEAQSSSMWKGCHTPINSRIMLNLEEFLNKGEMRESSKKLKMKFETMKGYEGDERVMFEFIPRDFTKSEMWDKVKEPLSPRLNEHEHSICCENTTHMMNALKEARMESR